MTIDREHWRPIPGYERQYEVSSFGRVRSVERIVKGSPTASLGRIHKGRILKATRQQSGCLMISLWSDNKGKWCLIHRLVLLAFKGPCPEGEESCHLDGNPGNNMLSNLEWGTSSQNKQDRNVYGNHQLGSKGTQTKLTAEEVRSIRLRHRSGDRVSDLIAEFRGRGSAADVIYNYTWKPERYYNTIEKQVAFFLAGHPEVQTKIEATLVELRLIDVDETWYRKAAHLLEDCQHA